jgi:hypothetical protein
MRIQVTTHDKRTEGVWFDDVPADVTVAVLKEMIAERFSCPSQGLRLVFNSKIGKDADRLQSLNVTDGSCLVVWIPKSPAPNPPPPKDDLRRLNRGR